MRTKKRDKEKEREREREREIIKERIIVIKRAYLVKVWTSGDKPRFQITFESFSRTENNIIGCKLYKESVCGGERNHWFFICGVQNR